MAKKQEQERVHLHVTLRPDLADRLKRRAAKMGWSLRVAFERLLDEALDGRDEHDKAIKSAMGEPAS